MTKSEIWNKINTAIEGENLDEVADVMLTGIINLFVYHKICKHEVEAKIMIAAAVLDDAPIEELKKIMSKPKIII